MGFFILFFIFMDETFILRHELCIDSFSPCRCLYASLCVSVSLSPLSVYVSLSVSVSVSLCISVSLFLSLCVSV